jgi:hypothetical protein
MPNMPGTVRDAILDVLTSSEEGMNARQIQERIEDALDKPVPPSSVRSYLQLNTPGLFERVGRGLYRVARK